MGQQGQVAARDRRMDLTNPVERMWVAGIVKVLPFQRHSERLDIWPSRPAIVERGSHRRMEGGNSKLGFNMRM